MRTVRGILQAKGYEIWSIAPEASVFEALQLMADKNVGAVLVIDAGHLVGVLSERDYARKVILKGKASRDTRVRDIMSQEVVFVRPDQTLEECSALMTENRVRHVPVYDGDRLMGIVSIGDVLKGIIADQALTIEQLGDYIVGGTSRPEAA